MWRPRIQLGRSNPAAGLGTVVIGGLTSSTFLTLLVIPAIYAFVDRLKRRLARRLRPAGERAVMALVREPTGG